MGKSSHDSIGFRAWYYFRMGWSTYFAFIFAAINTLTVTYYLAIENYPSLKEIFPSFEVYIIIICSIGIPLLTIIGYVHYKRTKARKAEVDILIETNPYVLRTLVNSDMLVILNLKILSLLQSIGSEKLTDDQKKEMKKINDELLEFTKTRKFRGTKDLEYFKNIDRKWFD
ncbi:MAG: hypothetical protein CMG15_08690 [Candidatus Marinimicrobia bacterium]|nr:hypothetical protein [Candidatus Neomarinimicrobiota bacterium]|tara:strand:+ start:4092 stop:4604 length:513 start_codon:yes stop_codon:yes gene_type:complete